MSKPYLLPDKYNSSKCGQDDYPINSDNVIGVSSSYIRKQGSQAKSTSQQKTYQNMKEAIPGFVAASNTMPLSQSKKISDPKEKMDSSVALPKIVKQFDFDKPNNKYEHKSKYLNYQRRERSAVKKISMEGLAYHRKQDNSTRNDIQDSDGTAKDTFSKTIKDKSASFKTPARNSLINQTPKLVGVTKLISSSNKRSRERDRSSSSDKAHLENNSSLSCKRKSSNTSQHMHNVKKTEDVDDNLRKTKTSIGDTKELKGMLVETEKIRSKNNNPDRLLESIIQSRCLTKDQERSNYDKQQEFRLPQEENYDSNRLKENITIKNSNRDMKERKSVTSNKERKDDAIVEPAKETRESPHK